MRSKNTFALAILMHGLELTFAMLCTLTWIQISVSSTFCCILPTEVFGGPRFETSTSETQKTPLPGKESAWPYIYSEGQFQYFAVTKALLPKRSTLIPVPSLFLGQGDKISGLCGVLMAVQVLSSTWILNEMVTGARAWPKNIFDMVSLWERFILSLWWSPISNNWQ